MSHPRTPRTTPEPGREHRAPPAERAAPRGEEAIRRGIAANREPHCSIRRLEVGCDHEHRSAHPEHGLCVVAETGSHNAQYGRRMALPGGFQIGWQGRRSWGGEDTVKARVVTVREATGRARPLLGRKQTCHHESPTPSGWQRGAEREYSIPAPDDDSFFPIDAEPRIHFLSGRGCDSRTATVRVLSFPSQQTQVQLDVALFHHVIYEINEKIHHTLTVKAGPVTMHPAIVGPQGSLGASWGWKESREDWRAYFEINLEAGLRPAFGYELSVRFSFVHLAGTVGLGALGVPPNLASWLMDLGTEYLADLFCFWSIELTVHWTGQLTWRKFHAPEREDHQGRAMLRPALESMLRIGLEARAGGESWLSVGVRGQASTGLSLEGGIEVDAEGVFLAPELKWPGVTLQVTLYARAFGAEESHEASWQPLTESTLWKPEGERWRLAI